MKFRALALLSAAVAIHLFASACLAQVGDTITGRITSSATGLPLKGAIVVLSAAGSLITTDTTGGDGTFQFTESGEKEYSLLVVCVGYRPEIASTYSTRRPMITTFRIALDFADSTIPSYLLSTDAQIKTFFKPVRLVPLSGTDGGGNDDRKIFAQHSEEVPRQVNGSVNVPNGWQYDNSSLQSISTSGSISSAPIFSQDITINGSAGDKLKLSGEYAYQSILQNNEAGNVSLKKDIDPKNAEIPGVEEYKVITEGTILSTDSNRFSTFSIDVDRASYSNIRRYLRTQTLPPQNAVRIEEMINYFTYDYPQPSGDAPFSITTDMSECPWNPERKLVRIGLQGTSMNMADLPPNNLVFLIDVSGSMSSENKLSLIQKGLRLLVQELRPRDRVAIVVYAGSAGLVLPSTPGSDKQTIADAIERLSAGGSTAGGQGIALAYRTALENFIEDGNNRVILATDGDFNVGISSEQELVELIEKKRSDGIFLTVLGVGTGNLKDGKMEQLADKGNGNYAYLDDIEEARKVLVKELGATLLTIAKDVKIQVEFNPEFIRSYRLIGYENRTLRREDFHDDKKDAGELGAGHSVTALYEIELADGAESPRDEQGGSARPHLGAREQSRGSISHASLSGDTLMYVKLRYKRPDEDQSKLLLGPMVHRAGSSELASEDLKFITAVTEFGMLLRNSAHKGKSSVEEILRLAQEGRGADVEGYRGEFIKMVEQYRNITTLTSP